MLTPSRNATLKRLSRNLYSKAESAFEKPWLLPTDAEAHGPWHSEDRYGPKNSWKDHKYPPHAYKRAQGRSRAVLLNRVSHRNAMNVQMIRFISRELKAYETSQAAIASVLRGSAYCDAFCVGHDHEALYKAGKKQDEYIHIYFQELYNLIDKIPRLKVPCLPILYGFATGPGLGLGLHNSYTFASHDSEMVFPETGMGYAPDCGMAHVLARLNNNLGIYLALTGHSVKGLNCIRAGLARNLSFSDAATPLEESLASMATTNEYVEYMVQTIDARSRLRYKTLCDMSWDLQPHLSLIDSAFGKPTVEAILTALEKDGSDFAKKTREVLLKKSPISLKVTLKHVRDAAKLPLTTVLKRDYLLIQRFLKRPDYYIAIDNILNKNEQAPKWSYRDVTDVNVELVNSFFYPASEEEKALYLYSDHARFPDQIPIAEPYPYELV